MNSLQLNNLKFQELKEIAIDMHIKIPKKKEELISLIKKCFEEYELYKKEKIDKYEKIEQLGNKGKEGITYLVKSSYGKYYAMKTFKKTKSSKNIKKEASLQEKASDFDIAPKVIDIDTVSKYIVMERMSSHLYDSIKKQNGNLTEKQQKQLIKIYKGLDEAKVFHADSNILNYMYKDKKLYIIDFGMSSEIDDKLIKKLGTNNPNVDIMTLGFILKLKEFKCPSSAYSHLIKYISSEEIKRFNLDSTT